MIPFADCINHHNVDSTYELIHRDYHKYAYEDKDHPNRGPPQYYSQSKLDGDYSDFLDYDADSDSDDDYNTDATLKQAPPKVLSQRTLYQMKKIIKRRETLSMSVTELLSHPTKEIWDVDYMTTSDEEDNDSEPE